MDNHYLPGRRPKNVDWRWTGPKGVTEGSPTHNLNGPQNLQTPHKENRIVEIQITVIDVPVKSG